MKHAEVAEYQSILGWIHGDLAAAYVQVGQMESAASQYEAAYDVWKRLSTSSTPHYLASAAMSLENWSDFLGKQGQHELAEEKLKEAIHIRQQLFEQNQSTGLSRRFLAASMFRLALLQGKTDRVDGAVSTYRRILQLVPDYAEAHCNLGHKLQNLDSLPRRLSRSNEAMNWEAHCLPGIIHRKTGSSTQNGTLRSKTSWLTSSPGRQKPMMVNSGYCWPKPALCRGDQQLPRGCIRKPSKQMTSWLMTSDAVCVMSLQRAPRGDQGSAAMTYPNQMKMSESDCTNKRSSGCVRIWPFAKNSSSPARRNCVKKCKIS